VQPAVAGPALRAADRAAQGKREIKIVERVEKEANMRQDIRIINLGGVNCYLVNTGQGYLLIDTGFLSKRAKLEQALELAGCRPGNLQLILLTHGDTDHADNAAYLREKYGAQIALHALEAPLVERGDMSSTRKAKPDKIGFIFKVMIPLAPVLFKTNAFEYFKPDFTIDEDFDLSEYGFAAKVLHLPGHSKGSIGIVTSEDFTAQPAGAGPVVFCGDLLYNFIGRPSCQLIDDLAYFKASLEKLSRLEVKTVYPGHGKPFPLERVLQRS
jgi:glyoxylase-like metal-dependent hydrolase (beta-lactamase superfamily II)